MSLNQPLYRGLDRETLDREYNARASVPSFAAEHARYVAESARVKREIRHVADIVYDPLSGQRLDFYPAHPGAPVFVWIHGGYWRGGSKEDNAFVVPGLRAHGVSVAVIDYALAPAVSLDEIVRQVRCAIAYLHANRERHGIAAGPMAVGGSSAGGHLVGMLLAQGCHGEDWHGEWNLPPDTIGVALALSGLYDIEPLRHTHIDAWLGLDDASIARNSPILHVPRQSAACLLASVGGLETGEFRRQTTAYAEAWEKAGHTGRVIDMPRHNHFDIALSLRERDGVLTRAVAQAIRERQ
ncbi:alpha/beta hydrolase [Pseudochelatococcus sp. B33]